MLSLIRELPWPSIIKVFALGIACKTLYIFYSESSEKQDDTKDQDLKPHPTEPIPPSEPVQPSQESPEELNSQMKLVYQELIKILPQLENIYDKLESIHTKLGHTKPIHTPEFIIDSNHVNLINENVLIEKILFEQSQFIQDQVHFSKDDFKINEALESDLQKETALLIKQDVQEKETASLIKQDVQEKERDSLVQEKEIDSVVNKVQEKEIDPVVNKVQENERDSVVNEVQEKDNESELHKTDLQVEFKLSCETHNETEALDTPKSMNEKTCSFILRSGLRKGQLCNSKVKGKTQIYCGIHR